MSYGRKTIIFYENFFKFSKNNSFNNAFCHRILPYYRFLPSFEKLLNPNKFELGSI